MTLPDATAIAAAVTFANAIYSGLAVFASVFAVVALFRFGPYIVRRLLHLIPG